MQVQNAGEEKNSDREPADETKLLPDSPKQLGAELRRFDSPENRCADCGQEEHAAQPEQGCKYVNRDVDVVRGHVFRIRLAK